MTSKNTISPKNRKSKKDMRNEASASIGASIKDVAKLAGVSVASVSRVINNPDTNRASKHTKKRILKAVRDLDYRPSPSGASLRSGKSRLVSFLIPNSSNAYISAVTDSLEASLGDQNLLMILSTTHEDPILQDKHLQEMRSHRVKGIVMLAAVDSPLLKECVESGELIVFVNRKSPVGIDAPFVGIDNYRASKEVARFFIEHELFPASMLIGPQSSSTSRDRYRGFLDQMTAVGEKVEHRFVTGGHSSNLRENYLKAKELLTQKSRPRGIFCSNDVRAYAVYKLCMELGLNVPEDVVIFGFDDNPMNEVLAPWLNTVRTPYSKFGPAVREIFEQIWSGEIGNSQPQKILRHKLVIRTEF